MKISHTHIHILCNNVDWLAYPSEKCYKNENVILHYVLKKNAKLTHGFNLDLGL